MARSVILAIIIFFFCYKTRAQWFDQQSINSTVSLEKRGDTSFAPFGTGFAVHSYSLTRTIIVTCAHLLRRSEIYVAVNVDSMFLDYMADQKADTVTFVGGGLDWVLDGRKVRARINLRSGTHPTYLIHPDLDIGVFLVDIPAKDTRRIPPFKISKMLGIPKSQFHLRKGIGLGDELYFVGFPFGIGSEGNLAPLVRSGSVAWLSETENVFLLDAFSFGGNSGSPVFTKMAFGQRPGVGDHPYLVGMIIGHLGENVSGILVQPDPKIPSYARQDKIELNYGLAQAVWLDSILPLINQALTLDLGD